MFSRFTVPTLLLFLILVLPARADSTGTGFFVSGDGYLVTNHHVIEGGREFFVRQGETTRPATLVAVDDVNDLALLKVAPEATPFPFFAVQGAVPPTPGSDVFTIGFPDPETLGVTPKTTKGSITALNGIKDDPRYYQMSVQIQPGNSGGPLIDGAGHVIGVTTLTINSFNRMDKKGYVPQNINYAVKAPYLMELFKRVPGVMLGTKLSGLQKLQFRDVQREAESAVMLVITVTTAPAPTAPSL